MAEWKQEKRYDMDKSFLSSQPGVPQYELGPPVPLEPMPRLTLGYPPGLTSLVHLDQVLVHQQLELLESFTGWEMRNKYHIKTVQGQQVYFVAEESSDCMRHCCKEKRSFLMHVVDSLNQEVIRIVRPFQGYAGCCWCAECNEWNAWKISVESPPGNVIGHVRQRCSKWKAHYDIIDANSHPVMNIRGPCCPFQAICCKDDIDFPIMTYDDQEQIGKISKQWAGYPYECCTKVDHFYSVPT